MSAVYAVLSIVCAVWFMQTNSPVAAFFGGANLIAAIFHTRKANQS